MGLDIKLPIGLFFTIVGIIITISGIYHRQEVLTKLGFNFSLIWGLVMLGFGIIMLIFHLFEGKKGGKE